MELAKNYNPKESESQIYQLWEKNQTFQPKIYQPGEKTFSIIMPPPNANDNLHIGHALFASIEDLMTRYHRLKGEATVWIPGSDHAGFETQYVFEKKLKKEGKSRFDFERDELYQAIWDYVQEQKSKMENQLKILGASCDWSREIFTLDPEVVQFTQKTFKNLYDKGLIYRGERIVNFCTYHGTSFSDLEVIYTEEPSKLWRFRYPIKTGGFIEVDTTRPETMLGDTAVAVNPDDDRYKSVMGQTIILPIINREIPIVGDRAVDKEFGTGAVKVTPAHDPVDFEIAQRHHLPIIKVIGLNGKMSPASGEAYQGLKTLEARERVLTDLKDLQVLIGEKDYTHSVGKCYKCETAIEPMVIPQWFIKVKPLADRSIKAIKEKKVRIIPDRYTDQVIAWYSNLKDWNISRQIVWGIQIPAWFCQGQLSQPEASPPLEENVNGQMSPCPPIVTAGEKPAKCPNCSSTKIKQDSDVFDTWFSSGQWPVIVNYVNDLRQSCPIDQPQADSQRFYPSTVMETAADILMFWVSRMVMLGLELRDDIPFSVVYLHGLVLDPHGKKMSKSKGNVTSPIELIDRYGADGLRFGLLLNAVSGSNLPLPVDDMMAGQKFANKIWNISRFLQMRLGQMSDLGQQISKSSPGSDLTQKIKNLQSELIESVTEKIEKYRFHEALETLYHSIWHEFADKILEESKPYLIADKEDEDDSNEVKKALADFWLNCLIMLHPFMPFITETIHQELYSQNQSDLLINQTWPN